MGLAKQYLRYKAGGVCNVIGSSRAGLALLLPQKSKQKSSVQVVVGTCENAKIWNLRTSEVAGELRADEASDNRDVSSLAVSANQSQVAVGYVSGTVRLFNSETRECVVTFNGHRREVHALNYDPTGMRLVSAGADTGVVIWDVVNESGLYRLKGHKKEVMQARFLQQHNFLLTCSKDETLKLWDLDTQHCFKTILGHTSEVWDFVLVKSDSLLVTGSKDMELRVWKLSYNQAEESSTDNNQSDEEREGEESDEQNIVRCEKVGTILRQGKGHCVSMSVSQDGSLLSCHGTDSYVELFKIPADEELHKVLIKRTKKIKKKALKEGVEADDGAEVCLTVTDMVKQLSRFKLSAKIRNTQLYKTSDSKVKVVALLCNNSIESYSVDFGGTSVEQSGVSRVVLQGHRTDIRAVCFSSDNTALVTGSAESVRVWNRSSLQCIRSMDSEYCLCCVFAPGDRHVIIGTMSGKLQIFDIAAGTLLETLDAHEGEVWSLCLAPDKKSIVSGGQDKCVKFWLFELISHDNATSKTLTLVHRKTLQMSSEVLFVKYSSDYKFLAVALMDSTVKVFFADTLKFSLSLYGHKLPVLCLDMATDGTVMVTGSQDKNVYIWDLSFGNILKRLFAHDGSVTSAQFIPKTHMFFSAGKDRRIKQWDADNFQHITTLEGHQADVWCLAVSPSGLFLASAGHDRSLRLWEKTDEIMVLEEEQEKEREREMDEKLENRGEDMETVQFLAWQEIVSTNHARSYIATVNKSKETLHVIGSNDFLPGEKLLIPGETSEEIGRAGRKTKETDVQANRLLEALDLHAAESQILDEHRLKCQQTKQQVPSSSVTWQPSSLNVYAPVIWLLPMTHASKRHAPDVVPGLENLPDPAVHVMFQAFGVKTPNGYMLEVIKRLKSSELEECLLVLPFSYVTRLLSILNEFIESGWEVELSSRCLLYLLRVHCGQISSNQILVPVIDKLRANIKVKADVLKDRTGFNLAGLRFLQQQIEDRCSVRLFADATAKRQQKKRKRAVLTLRT